MVKTPPLGPSGTAGGLSQLDLPTVFRCGVELAEATAILIESEWADLPADCEGPTSPIFERWIEASHRLHRIGEETIRLKGALGASGPFEFRDGDTDGGPTWESYDQRFSNTGHDRLVRLALVKMATAAIDLSGFATWRERQWQMQKTGLRLISWALAQLWQGMSDAERSEVRDRLPRTHKAINWPANPSTDPPAYDGPEEIPSEERYRTIANYISCRRGYLDDMQNVANCRIEEEQRVYLSRATPQQVLEEAERAARATEAMFLTRYDTSSEWAELYHTAFWPLICLRQASQIPPRESWTAEATDRRNLLADAAGALLISIQQKTKDQSRNYVSGIS